MRCPSPLRVRPPRHLWARRPRRAAPVTSRPPLIRLLPRSRPPLRRVPRKRVVPRRAACRLRARRSRRRPIRQRPALRSRPCRRPPMLRGPRLPRLPRLLMSPSAWPFPQINRRRLPSPHRLRALLRQHPYPQTSLPVRARSPHCPQPESRPIEHGRQSPVQQRRAMRLRSRARGSASHRLTRASR